MHQSTDPESLSNKEDSKEEALVSMGRENRIDFTGGLSMVVNGNSRYQVRCGGCGGGRKYLER